MGLDITAYEQVEYAGPYKEDYDYRGGICVFYITGISQADSIKQGLYKVSGEEFGFRAGSYSGYNSWRADLCQLILGCTPEIVWGDPEKFAGKPFVELINFSDCEGTIGPQTSAKLAKDFDEWKEKALEDASMAIDKDDGKWFMDKYNDWQKAFKLAAGKGAVSFH